MLIGSQPGQICGTRSEVGRGALVSCPFSPVWAVQVGSRPGAEVLVLGKAEEPAKFDPQQVTRSGRQNCQRWAGIIYDAHIRHARFVWRNRTVPVERLNSVWKQYAAAAKRIKRALKEK